MNTWHERQQVIDAAVFRTITGEDWRRQLAAARQVKNAVAERIRAAVKREELRRQAGTAGDTTKNF